MTSSADVNGHVVTRDEEASELADVVGYLQGFRGHVSIETIARVLGRYIPPAVLQAATRIHAERLGQIAESLRQSLARERGGEQQ